jgi:hypothetical protein
VGLDLVLGKAPHDMIMMVVCILCVDEVGLGPVYSQFGASFWFLMEHIFFKEDMSTAYPSPLWSISPFQSRYFYDISFATVEISSSMKITTLPLWTSPLQRRYLLLKSPAFRESKLLPPFTRAWLNSFTLTFRALGRNHIASTPFPGPLELLSRGWFEVNQIPRGLCC